MLFLEGKQGSWQTTMHILVTMRHHCWTYLLTTVLQQKSLWHNQGRELLGLSWIKISVLTRGKQKCTKYIILLHVSIEGIHHNTWWMPKIIKEVKYVYNNNDDACKLTLTKHDIFFIWKKALFILTIYQYCEEEMPQKIFMDYCQQTVNKLIKEQVVHSSPMASPILLSRALCESSLRTK